MVWRDHDIGRADVLEQLLQIHESGKKYDIFLQPQLADPSLQLQPVGFPFEADHVRVGRAEHHVTYLGMFFHNGRQRFDDVLYSFIAIQEAEREQHPPTFNAEFVFVEARIDKGHVVDAVGDEGNFITGDTKNIIEYRYRPLAHDNDLSRPPANFVKDLFLCRQRIFQDGVASYRERMPKVL